MVMVSRSRGYPRPRSLPGFSGLFRFGLALMVFATTAVAAAAQEPGGAGETQILRATLENGLRVILVRNRLAPVVTTGVNYLVGADETPPGFPGMAHAQEHMMFRGSPGLSAEALANIGAVMGGRFDADTRQTVTQYFFTVPAEDLDVALHIEALRMRDVDDAQADWEKERGAIEQEVTQDLSSPRYVLQTRLREALFAGTPYAHDALGTIASFNKTTGAMLKTFHEKWYAPNNAVLIVVGDLDPAATLAKVKTLFESIPSKKLPARPEVKLQPVKAQSLSLASDLSYGLSVVAFRMPGLDSPDYAAIEVLADVLSSQRGELYGLVPQGKALSTDFSLDSLPKASLGYAVAAFPAGGDAKAVAQDVRAALAGIAKAGVSADLVEAAKRQERRAAEFAKNSISGLAEVWSEAVAVDGLHSPDDDLARIDKVTVADVNRVARQYLDFSHAVTAVLLPQGSGKPVASQGFGGRESIALAAAKPAPLPDWAQQALGRLSVPESTLHPMVTKLENGITLIVQPEDVSDTVTVVGHVENRPDLQVPKGKEGMSQVLDELFSYGSESLDRIAFQRALDEIGADEQAGTDFSLHVLADGFERGTALLADNELHPAFPAQAFTIVRQQVAQSVAGRLKSPGYLASRALHAAIFPEGDPTLRQALPETVDSITLDDLRAYYKSAFRPDLTTIVVMGKVTPEQAKSVIEKYFGAWRAEGPKPATDLPAVPLSKASTVAVPDASRVQDKVTLAETIGIDRANPDYYALKLGNNVLGGAFYSTRLYRDLRMNNGLVYFVGSYFAVGKTRGLYLVEYACDPKNVSKVQAIVARELMDMRSKPVSTDELQQAKAILLRTIPLDEADVDGIAQGFLDRVHLGLPLDEPLVAARHYVALDANAVRAAFAKWLRPDDLARVSQGPMPR
ncbi:MAG TPA: pitrilysin family protein [Alphaproteobacteria bacterium]|nr:pitrilysin family protein [Alphaproteobacteria bacterium]